jgi:hypothetical protein
MRYIKHNDPQSTYALHVLNNKHGYGLISSTVSLLKQVCNVPLLIPFEQFYIPSPCHYNKLVLDRTQESTTQCISWHLTFILHHTKDLDPYACHPTYLVHHSTGNFHTCNYNQIFYIFYNFYNNLTFITIFLSFRCTYSCL